jgi:hypothetical protein
VYIDNFMCLQSCIRNINTVRAMRASAQEAAVAWEREAREMVSRIEVESAAVLASAHGEAKGFT